MFARSRRLVATMSVAAALTLSLVACSNEEEPAGGSSGAGGGGGEDVVAAVTKDDAAAKLLPKEIADKGKLIVGSDTSYPPNEYIDENNQIVGMDVDLGKAIGKKLGVEVEFQTAPFDSLLAALGSKYDLGISSFTDNKEREEVVDFVTYYEAGTAWAVKTGTTLDIDDACGRKVAVQTGTVQETDDLPARQSDCEAEGKDPIDVQSYENQGDATTAVVTGKAEAMLADLPVVLDAIDKTEGQLEQTGEQYDAAPYGIAIPKSGGKLKDAVLAALKAMIADGSYTKILAKWKAEVGAITDPVINGATG